MISLRLPLSSYLKALVLCGLALGLALSRPEPALALVCDYCCEYSVTSATETLLHHCDCCAPLDCFCSWEAEVDNVHIDSCSDSACALFETTEAICCGWELCSKAATSVTRMAFDCNDACCESETNAWINRQQFPVCVGTWVTCSTSELECPCP